MIWVYLSIHVDTVPFGGEEEMDIRRILKWGFVETYTKYESFHF